MGIKALATLNYISTMTEHHLDSCTHVVVSTTQTYMLPSVI